MTASSAIHGTYAPPAVQDPITTAIFPITKHFNTTKVSTRPVIRYERIEEKGEKKLVLEVFLSQTSELG
jgi:hypothetical protein